MRTLRIGSTALSLMLSVVMGCAPPDETEETSSDVQASPGPAKIQDIDLDLGTGTPRVLHRECSHRCEVHGTGPKGTHPCLRWVDDCATPVTANLYADRGALARGEIFPAYFDGYHDGVDKDGRYLGCGRTAVQNVLAYYGKYVNLSDLVSAVPANFASATTPDELMYALQGQLDRYWPGKFAVSRKSYVDVRWEVRHALNAGNPIIVLVHGGNHWQVATGLTVGDYTMIDYAGPPQTVYGEDALGINIEFHLAWFSIGYQGYYSNTVITIERR
jgi:hypothetical protein